MIIIKIYFLNLVKRIDTKNTVVEMKSIIHEIHSRMNSAKNELGNCDI